MPFSDSSDRAIRKRVVPVVVGPCPSYLPTNPLLRPREPIRPGARPRLKKRAAPRLSRWVPSQPPTPISVGAGESQFLRAAASLRNPSLKIRSRAPHEARLSTVSHSRSSLALRFHRAALDQTCRAGTHPGRRQPCGPRGHWSFDVRLFAEWWKAGKREDVQWQTSISEERLGGLAPLVKDVNSVEASKQKSSNC